MQLKSGACRTLQTKKFPQGGTTATLTSGPPLREAFSTPTALWWMNPREIRPTFHLRVSSRDRPKRRQKAEPRPGGKIRRHVRVGNRDHTSRTTPGISFRANFGSHERPPQPTAQIPHSSATRADGCRTRYNSPASGRSQIPGRDRRFYGSASHFPCFPKCA